MKKIEKIIMILSYQGAENSNSEIDSEEEEHFQLATTCTKPVSKNFKLSVNESMRFIVDFSPKHVSKLSAEIRLSVMDNPFEDTTVIMIGEGYAEEVTLDNIRPQKTLVVDEQIDIEDKNFIGWLLGLCCFVMKIEVLLN